MAGRYLGEDTVKSCMYQPILRRIAVRVTFLPSSTLKGATVRAEKQDSASQPVDERGREGTEGAFKGSHAGRKNRQDNETDGRRPQA
jgi:hypothetical protein